MERNNIFNGEGSYVFFVKIAYKRLMTRKWVTYADVMKEYLGAKSQIVTTCGVSKCESYGELKKAFRDIRRAINDKLGEECVETDGNNRNKRFRYKGKDDDPLVDMRNADTVSRLKKYWQFCQGSVGFLPTPWLDYFFKGSRDLLDIKSRRKKGEQVLSASLDRMLVNIEFLPLLYEAIVQKKVLSIDYKPYDEEIRNLIFHPHYLKEYNGRWHLFGHAEGKTPEVGYNVALDRIVGEPSEICNQSYISASPGFYKAFFNDIVGVSHKKDAKVEDIRIRAHFNNIFKLTETKPIHHSQQTVMPFGVHEDGEYGEFLVSVEVNNEFIGRILQMGAGLEIVAPEGVRNEFKERVANLADLYK